MTDIDTDTSLALRPDTFSQPYGTAQMYGRPPFHYRNTRTVTVAYRSAATPGLAEILPPGVELVDDEPLVTATATHNVESSFGAYDEFWFYVQVRFRGETYMYNPLMYVSADSSMAAGREIWGFPKKIATTEWRAAGETMIFTGARPAFERLLSIAFTPGDATATPMGDEIARYESLIMRVIPSVDGSAGPDVAQLVATSNERRIRLDAAGAPQRWRGQGVLDLGAGTANDPVGLFAPVEILDAWMSYSDFEIGAGYVVHDYLRD